MEKDRLKSAECRLLSLIEGQINGDISCVDAKELGEVVDMMKDFAEYRYYASVADAMEESSEEEKEHYMSEYAPATRRMYSVPRMGGRRMYPMEPMMDDSYRSRMYYSEPRSMNSGGNASMSGNSGNMNYAEGYGRDYREGRSGISRRTYMEMKDSTVDKNHKVEEIKKYGHDLTDDIMEMVQNATPEEKQAMKQTLTQLVSKIA